jgi:hypothetical protein
MNQPLELSCYTANLVTYLEPERPAIRAELADAIRLSVRTDPPEGGTAYAHHARVDLDSDGGALAYRAAGGWTEARTALRAELNRHGRVLAVGNTRHLPWSPSYGISETPHWVVLLPAAGDGWTVVDDFAALTPRGRQDPHTGHLGDEDLRLLLTPLRAVTPEAANRDRYALGQEVALPGGDGYRWLERTDAWESAAAGEPAGTWVHGVVPALRHIAGELCSDAGALARHADDLWTVCRHQRYRLAAGSAAKGADQEAVARAAAAWEELPRAVRFAIASAERGRFRGGLVEKAFAQVTAAVENLDAVESLDVAASLESVDNLERSGAR